MSVDTETQVKSVMSKPIETISASEGLREAAKTMREHDINAMLVLGGEVGIVTSTDVLDAVAEGRNPAETTVEDVMTVPVESVNTELRLQEAAAMMLNYGINHLPVRDTSGDYVGMISSTDLSKQLAES